MTTCGRLPLRYWWTRAGSTSNFKVYKLQHIGQRVIVNRSLDAYMRVTERQRAEAEQPEVGCEDVSLLCASIQYPLHLKRWG